MTFFITIIIQHLMIFSMKFRVTFKSNLSNEEFLEKILKMFIFIYENVTKYDIMALQRQYCYLTYDRAILSSHDNNPYDVDDGDDDGNELEKEMEITNKNERSLQNKNRSFSSLTRKNIRMIEKFYKNVTEKIETELKFV